MQEAAGIAYMLVLERYARNANQPMVFPSSCVRMCGLSCIDAERRATFAFSGSDRSRAATTQ